MEVSSHGLDMHRVDGTRFAVAVFTNLVAGPPRLPRDDGGLLRRQGAAVHPRSCPSRGVVCVDDDVGPPPRRARAVPVTTYGTDAATPTTASSRSRATSPGPPRPSWGPTARRPVRTRLVGDYNVTNAVGAYLAAVAVGVPPEAAARGGRRLSPACPDASSGSTVGQPFAVLVDYAHTPDALEHVVAATASAGRRRRTAAPRRRLRWGPRPRQAPADGGGRGPAADRAVLTSDNPRSRGPAGDPRRDRRRRPRRRRRRGARRGPGRARPPARHRATRSLRRGPATSWSSRARATRPARRSPTATVPFDDRRRRRRGAAGCRLRGHHRAGPVVIAVTLADIAAATGGTVTAGDPGTRGRRRSRPTRARSRPTPTCCSWPSGASTPTGTTTSPARSATVRSPS